MTREREAVAILRAIRDDMLMRAKMNAHQNDGEIIVEMGAGNWVRLNRFLDGEKW